jgi:hypothetical protein
VKSFTKAIIISLVLITTALAQTSPRLLFTQVNYGDVQTRYRSASNPYAIWKSKIIAVSDAQPLDSEAAEFDESMSLKAKLWACRYAMEDDKSTEERLSYGSSAYKWNMGTESGFTNVRSSGYEISPTWNRWMVNGLALINYCQAYDMLVGSGYFDTIADGANKKTAAKNKILSRVTKLYDQVKTSRAIIDLSPPSSGGLFWWLDLFDNPNFSTLENQT